MKFIFNNKIFIINKIKTNIIYSCGAKPGYSSRIGTILLAMNGIYNIKWNKQENSNENNNWYYLSSIIDNNCIKVEENNKIINILYGE